jgi:hypothetical protein
MKRKKTSGKLLAAIGFLLIAFSVNGQTGSIEGTVIDKATGEPLTGATVQIVGTTTGKITDSEGNFTLPNLKAGTYNLLFSFVSYNQVLMENVKVEPGNVSKISTTLEESVTGLAEVNVTAVRRSGSELSMITDIRSNQFVSTGISGQQISRTLDKDASEVVKRIPGITVQDDRFIIVRGLNERYNNVWLNNVVTPSAEADVRAFSFDIIPSSVIENIVIVKSPVAELPADFSGGFVKITTKNMPDKNSTVLSYGTAYNEGTTFGSFRSFDGDWTNTLGFDKGAALPDNMPSHLNEYEFATNPDVRNRITTIGREINSTWSPVKVTAIPEQKLLLTLNRRFKIGQHQIGSTTAVTYSWSQNSDLINVNDYSIYDFTNDRSTYLNQFKDQRYTSSVRLGVMANWAVLFGNNTKIEFRNLFNQTGNKRITRRYGQEWYNDGRYIKSDELRYLSRSIYTGQIAGTHTPGSNGVIRLDWILGYSWSAKNEPDTKRYRYVQDQSNPDEYLLLFGDQADLSSISRMWIKLHENTVSSSVGFTVTPEIAGIRPEIKAGLYFEDKQRGFTARNFGYAKGSPNSAFGRTDLPVGEIFNDENINLEDGIKLVEVTSLSDSYKASNMQMSGYLSVKVPVTSRVNVYAGARLERNRQTLSSYKQGSTIKVDVNRDTINIFPSANLTYNFSDKNLIRMAYGMTINRPEFREIAPFYYVDFDMNAGIYGAPDIRQAYIHNYDLRFESYPSEGENFSIGLFYKNFLHPIEQVILGNSPTQYSFENVTSAYSAGIETELRKSLGFITALKNITLVVNASLIKSRVQFPEGSLSRDRSLEGQSPYIINTGFFYQNDKGLMVSLMYNSIGKRIVAVGRPSPNQWEDIPDIYEMPRNDLDISFSRQINRFMEIKGGINDILNEEVKYQQNINASVNMDIYSQGRENGTVYFDRDQATKTYTPGRTVVLGLSLKF